MLCVCVCRFANVKITSNVGKLTKFVFPGFLHSFNSRSFIVVSYILLGYFIILLATCITGLCLNLTCFFSFLIN